VIALAVAHVNDERREPIELELVRGSSGQLLVTIRVGVSYAAETNRTRGWRR
jgi:hypothetical protein